MRQRSAIRFLLKTACAALLGVFAFAVVGDPVTDLLFPHQGPCEVCQALAGGHGLASPDAGPALTCDSLAFAVAAPETAAPAPLVCLRLFLSRAPPALSIKA